jgi:predicted ester cyclase
MQPVSPVARNDSFLATERLEDMDQTNLNTWADTTAATAELVARFLATCLDPADPNAIDDFTTSPKIRAMHAGLCAAFPDARLVPAWRVVEGNRAAVGGTIRGTHLGEWRGVPATGRAVEAMSIAMLEWVEDELVDLSVVPDTLAIAEQLGLVPTLGPKSCQLGAVGNEVGRPQ